MTSSTRFAVWFLVLLTMGALPWYGVTSWGSVGLCPRIPRSPRSHSWFVGSGIFMFGLRCAPVARSRSSGVVADPFVCAEFLPAGHRQHCPLAEVLQAPCRRPISLYGSPSVRVAHGHGFFRR